MYLVIVSSCLAFIIFIFFIMQDRSLSGFDTYFVVGSLGIQH